MKRNSLPFTFALILVGVALVLLSSAAQAGSFQQNTAITLSGPSSCPPGGCAAGQRLSYHLQFELGQYDAAQTAPNVRVCLYIPSDWYSETASRVQLDATGGISSQTYDIAYNPTSCGTDQTPTNYILAAVGTVNFNNLFFFQDSLEFHFRIAPTATASGSVLMRVFELPSSGTWTRTQQVFTTQITPFPAASAATLYVAGDPAACTSNPCYLNSSGDLPGGIGAGLKDAVDAADSGAHIVVLGSVPVKGNTVQINKPLTVEGSGDATLTAVGDCSNALLEISAGGTLRNLNVNDGACTAPNRNLVSVNTNADLLIESNDLTGGGDAIRVANNSGNLTVRYNHIQGNSGYALFWDSGAPGGSLNMVANNVIANRSGDPVECQAGGSGATANRRADHNYWGGTSAPSASNTHCTISSGKRLGAPIAANTGAPGVVTARVTVTTTKTYRFDNQIALKRGAGGNDFDVYIVNHGAAAPDAVPFTNAAYANPNPCSDFWDIFLAEGVSPGDALELTLKYNRSSACLAVIESSQFCEQTSNSSKYPLWWYDPAGQVTDGWDTTGQSPAGSGAGGASGQTTACSMSNDEITVTIDNNGRPSLSSDLNYLPFVVGITVPATLKPYASDKTVTLVWTTTSEADLSGFTVMRSAASGGPFDPISDLIAKKGSALSGSSYSFVDGGRTNGVTNYYRLKITRTDGAYFYSDIVSIVPNVATITPTLTPSRTITPRPTVTPFFRLPTPTRIPTLTRRPPTPTRIGANSQATPTPLLVGTSAAQATSSQAAYEGPEDGSFGSGDEGYAAPGNGTATVLFASGTVVTPALSGTPGAPGARTRTPTPTGSLPAGETGAPRDPSEWISLVLGLLLSGAVVFGLAWFMFLRRKA